MASPERQMDNALVKAMARSLITQADTIRDEEPRASARRVHLLRASSHLLSAFAELEELDGLRADA